MPMTEIGPVDDATTPILTCAWVGHADNARSAAAVKLLSIEPSVMRNIQSRFNLIEVERHHISVPVVTCDDIAIFNRNVH